MITGCSDKVRSCGRHIICIWKLSYPYDIFAVPASETVTGSLLDRTHSVGIRSRDLRLLVVLTLDAEGVPVGGKCCLIPDYTWWGIYLLG